MLNYYTAQGEDQQRWIGPHQRSSFLIPIIISIFGVLAWLFFILFFALFWSKGYNLFQDIVVFIASVGIMGLLIGLMWLIWGRNQMHWGHANFDLN